MTPWGMRGNLWTIKSMEEVKFQDSRDNILASLQWMIKMVEESWSSKMEMYTRDTIGMVSEMAKGNICIIMEINTKDIGKMIRKRERALLKWKQAISIQDSGKMERSMVGVAIISVQGMSMKGSFLKEWDMAKASMPGLMEVFMRDNGKQIKWMESEFTEEWMEA